MSEYGAQHGGAEFSVTLSAKRFSRKDFMLTGFLSQ